MNCLFFTTSKYGDPCSLEWKPAARHTVFYLRKHNIDIRFLYVPVLKDPDAVIMSVGSVEPAVAYFHLEEENVTNTVSFIKQIHLKWPHALFVVGGMTASLVPRVLLKNEEIDFVVVGDEENGLLGLFDSLQGRCAVRDVAGLYSRDFHNEPSEPSVNLDELSMIYDGIGEMLSQVSPEDRVACLSSSRGCYFKCSFCSIASYNKLIPGKSWRGKSATAVVDEMEQLINAFGIKKFVFEDDCFFGPGYAGEQRARSLSAEIMRRQLDIEYSLCCTLHDINVVMLNELIASGLRSIVLSIESLNESSQILFNKGIRVEDIYPKLNMIEEHRLQCEVNMIFLEPGMDLEAVRKNLAFFDFLRQKQFVTYSDSFPFNELKPFPWTRASEILERQGRLNIAENSCRYVDSRVEKLARFIKGLRVHVNDLYKRSVPFFEKSVTRVPSSNRNVVSRLGRGIRDWVSLSHLPKTVGNACLIIEEGSSNLPDLLREEERAFVKEIDALRCAIQSALETVLISNDLVLEASRDNFENSNACN